MNRYLTTGDCMKLMQTMPHGEVDLIFADPPFNIGYHYDVYNDVMTPELYESWTHGWLYNCERLLAPTGSLWVAIGDEYAAELCVLAKKLGFHLRNWVVWHYTFGQATQTKFARCHTHLLYFTKQARGFTFNADAIRVPSARQTKYGDKRANPLGKVPDDVWVFSRVCGTFKERVKWHPCQMPEAVLDRIIRASSDPGDLVFDPFAGSGTTGVVAVRLGRKFWGIELSHEYSRLAEERIHEASAVSDDDSG